MADANIESVQHSIGRVTGREVEKQPRISSLFSSLPLPTPDSIQVFLLIAFFIITDSQRRTKLSPDLRRILPSVQVDEQRFDSRVGG